MIFFTEIAISTIGCPIYPMNETEDHKLCRGPSSQQIVTYIFNNEQNV